MQISPGVSPPASPPTQLPRLSVSGQEPRRSSTTGSEPCALKAAALRDHHPNEKEKNLLAGTEYQNEQFLLPRKVCPFLSALAEVKITSPEI